MAERYPDQAGLPLIPGDEDTRIHVLDDEEKRDILIAFAVLFTIVVQTLSRRVGVVTIKIFLRSLRCHITGKPFVSPDLYKHCKTTSEVLLSLEPVLINAMHPYLLRKIIENFGCEESRQAMREYDAMFPQTVALQNLGDPVPDWMIESCRGAKKIIVVIKGESDTITRGDVEDVQIALERDLEVERVFIVFAKHEERECVPVVSSLRKDEEVMCFYEQSLPPQGVPVSAPLLPPLPHHRHDPRFPGITFYGDPILKMVDSDGCALLRPEIGICLHIPPKAVPDGKALHLTVWPCLSGPFVPPDGHEFSSPVYLISPAFHFQKDVELSINHFEKLRYDEDIASMSFATTSFSPKIHASNPTYTFELLGKGEFK